MTEPLETIIEPRKGWQAIDFAELLRHRELLWFLVWRDIKVRYKQTVLGATWAILQPVFTMVVFTIIFGKFAKIPADGHPYAIFVYAGLLPWFFFANAVRQSGLSLVNQSHLLTKIYFPRLFVPTASVGAALVDFFLSFVVYVGLMVWFGYPMGLFMVVMLPVLVLLTVMVALGTGYLLSSLTVSYRDFRFVIPFLLQAWMYSSPVPYSMSMIPEKYRLIYSINPMAGIIGAFRSVLLGDPLNWASLGISTGVGAIIFIFGIYNFRRTERRFADIA